MPGGQAPTPQASHQASQARPGLPYGHTSWAGRYGLFRMAASPTRPRLNAHASSNEDLSCSSMSRVRWPCVGVGPLPVVPSVSDLAERINVNTNQGQRQHVLGDWECERLSRSRRQRVASIYRAIPLSDVKIACQWRFVSLISRG